MIDFARHKQAERDIDMQQVETQFYTTEANKYNQKFGFYLNNTKISHEIDVNQNTIEPVANDWQSADMIPTL